MNENNPQADAPLAQLKRALADEHAPDFVWARLAHAADVPAAPPIAAVARPRYWFLPPAVAVSLTAWLVWMASLPAIAPVAPSLLAKADGAFIALRSLESGAFETAEAEVIRTEVPRIWLAAAGVPVAPERASEPIQIDILVGQAGQALAFRIPNL
jgi:hypothetical protein